MAGIAVGPDNTVVVADSSNHRVQIFDELGQNRCLMKINMNIFGKSVTSF